MLPLTLKRASLVPRRSSLLMARQRCILQKTAHCKAAVFNLASFTAAASAAFSISFRGTSIAFASTADDGSRSTNVMLTCWSATSQPLTELDLKSTAVTASATDGMLMRWPVRSDWSWPVRSDCQIGAS